MGREYRRGRRQDRGHRPALRLYRAPALYREVRMQPRQCRRGLQSGRKGLGAILGTDRDRARQANPHPDRRRQAADPDDPRPGRRGRARRHEDQCNRLSGRFQGPIARGTDGQAHTACGREGRKRPTARQRRALPTRRALRRRAAASEVRRDFRHSRIEAGRRAAGDGAQRRTGAARPEPDDRRTSVPRRWHRRHDRRMAAHGRQGRAE